MEVIVYPDAGALALAAARRIARLVRERSADVFTIALAGGSTPAATYAALLDEDVPWDRVYGWIGDERFVPHDHPDSNTSMARRAIVEASGMTFLPVPWRDGATADELAAEYESALLGILDHDDSGPRPDLMLLGMGDDGHTLSLFPDTDALAVTDRWFTANWVASKDTWRLTATYPLAHRSREIIFLVAGGGKAAALRQVLEPADGEAILPSTGILDGGARVTFLVDAAAAAELVATETVPGIPPD